MLSRKMMSWKMNLLTRSNLEWLFTRRNTQYGEIVYHRAAYARVAKKNIKPCKTCCCCVSHYLVTEHRHKVVPAVANHYSHGKDNLFDIMLDGSWLGLEEFEDELCIIVNKDNTIMFLICSETLYLVDEYEEEMCSLANKDNTLLSLMCPVNLDLTDVVMEDLQPAWANTLMTVSSCIC